MEYVTLGRTNLMVSRSALGTRLLQDISDDDFAEIIDTSYKQPAGVGGLLDTDIYHRPNPEGYTAPN